MFRFLNLPINVRLIIYKHLPREITHRLVRVQSGRDAPRFHGVTLIMRSTHTAILRTCKLINGEATPIVHNTIQDFILNKPPQLAADNHHTNNYSVEMILECVGQEFVGLRAQVLGFQVGTTTIQRVVKYLTNYHDGSYDNVSGFMNKALKESGTNLASTNATLKAMINENMDVMHRFIHKSAIQLVSHDILHSHNKSLGRPTIQYMHYLPASQYRAAASRGDILSLVKEGVGRLRYDYTKVGAKCRKYRINKGLIGVAPKSSEKDIERFNVPRNHDYDVEDQEEDQGQVVVLPALTRRKWREEWLENCY
ncbi:hypothetical protein BDV96DRAFT_600350 [Lophiotrema nucula]|uniref:F-box domain-containing protein n=1 Tax=Lophiotrema nucula TaxID=690887 RepID=A0A6A5Z7K8_9PLEO|nr:hypothetical protein BDV96DRAFT_600350 [Lophiotrema nucula]